MTLFRREPLLLAVLALAPAAAFAVGAAAPLLIAMLVPGSAIIAAVAVGTLACLALLGAVAARTGGASASRGTLRVVFWGVLAMLLTALVGRLFGTTVLFDAPTLASLYPSHAAYVSAVNKAARKAVRQRYVLTSDAKMIKASAAASTIGN
jgi:hypothetical protein